ncbi:terpene synthase [Fusarium albosuccineum]|uniref:Terpene synthase n=1 Tax=Fusarium albosuccineum TaxID=1237068 RepID=A0A8H4PG79_9HYPO|nr:terpene synthase [Fusarium albosuccineum]
MKAARRLSQTAIVAALRGQTLRIPNLKLLLKSWPPAQLHRHHAQLTPIVDGAIDRMAATYPLIARRKGDDFASLAALWYPQASKPRIETLALYTTWLMCWDDAVDANEGDLAADFARAERWRSQTLDMIPDALKVDEKGRELSEDGGDPINSVFRQFGSRYCEAAPGDQRRRLHDEIQSFILSCATEQKLRLDRQIPEFDSYINLRIATVGGNMLCSLVPYATQEALPATPASAVYADHMWLQVSILLGLLNDMLSLKKELRTDCALNAVTTMMEPGTELDTVVARLVNMMKLAIQDFDDAGEKLLETAGSDQELRGVVTRYIDGCRAVVTGTLEFTYDSSS